MLWIWLVLGYGLIKGFREIIKKKAMTKNTVIEVLFVYTLLSFVFVLPEAKSAGILSVNQYLWVAAKAFAVFVAWICSFIAIKKLPVSVYGVLDLSRVLFATMLGVIVLGERMTGLHVFGLSLVSFGLIMIKFKPSFVKRAEMKEVLKNDGNIMEKIRAVNDGKVSGKQTAVFVGLAFLSCFLNAVSGTLDKILMKDMSSNQLQFWYMLFLLIYYFVYVIVTRTKITKTVWKNGWVWLLAVLFVIADKMLFVANGMEGSRVTIMTLIKQSSIIVTILAGRFIFKEKNTGYLMVCALVIVCGIIIGTI